MSARPRDAKQGEETMEAEVGDRITIEANRVGGGRRSGQIEEVIARGIANHYRVRWDDGHETVFFPSSDATIKHATR
jgi:hypothetical protein